MDQHKEIGREKGDTVGSDCMCVFVSSTMSIIVNSRKRGEKSVYVDVFGGECKSKNEKEVGVISFASCTFTTEGASSFGVAVEKVNKSP